MKKNIIAYVTALFFLVSCVSISNSLWCYPEETTVKGEISCETFLIEDELGGLIVKEVIELKDGIYVLDFSDKTNFDQTMKDPIPEGKSGSAIKMKNGEKIYFQWGREYEVIGELGNLEKDKLFPASKFQLERKHFLLSVKKIKMLNK